MRDKRGQPKKQSGGLPGILSILFLFFEIPAITDPVVSRRYMMPLHLSYCLRVLKYPGKSFSDGDLRGFRNLGGFMSENLWAGTYLMAKRAIAEYRERSSDVPN